MQKTHIKLLAILLIFSVLFISSPKPARADNWGANMMAAIWKQTMEEMYLYVKETVIANLKIAAIRIIQGRIQTLLTGNSGQFGIGGSGTLVITDWKQFINNSANKKSDKITTDFFNRLKSNAASGEKKIIESAERKLKESIYTPPDLHKYVAEGKKENIFKPGMSKDHWYAFGVSGLPQNSEIDIASRGGSLRATAYEMESDAKRTEGQAGLGYESKKKNRKIITPGSSIKDIVDEIQKMPIKMLTLARSIPEIVSNMVTQMITQMVNQGLAQITNQIDKQIMQFRNNLGLPMGQVQNYIQSGVKTVPSAPSPLPSGWNRHGQD
jgi:hypothetical protein